MRRFLALGACWCPPSPHPSEPGWPSGAAATTKCGLKLNARGGAVPRLRRLLGGGNNKMRGKVECLWWCPPSLTSLAGGVVPLSEGVQQILLLTLCRLCDERLVLLAKEKAWSLFRWHACMYVCMYVCMYACTSVRMNAYCRSMYAIVNSHANVNLLVHVNVSVSEYECAYGIQSVPWCMPRHLPQKTTKQCAHICRILLITT